MAKTDDVRPQMQNVANQWEFLIRVTPEYFLSAIDGGQVTGTQVLSAAQHFDYKSADRICAGLRAHGYRQAVVTDYLGQPVTTATLRGEAPPQDNLPRTLNDLNKIPVHEHRRRYKIDAAFRDRVDAIEATQSHSQ